MINLEEAINQAQSFITSPVALQEEFKTYARGYLFTTEYIDQYLKQLKISKGKALTVLSSGDHIFNLLLRGVTNIDAFDINKLNYFTFYLKRAFILHLSFYEFKKLETYFSKDQYLPYVYEYLHRSKMDMPEEVFHYYESLIQYKYTKKERQNSLRGLYIPSRTSYIPSNTYLKKEASYMELRKKLEDLKLTLYFGDAREIPPNLESEYDIILLSNIADYIGSKSAPLEYEDFKKFIDSYFSLLNKEGVVVSYLYGLFYKYIIQNSHITKEQLGLHQIHKLSRGLRAEGYYAIHKK